MCRPLPGTIRLVDGTNAPSLTGKGVFMSKWFLKWSFLGVGRLEYYLNGWGTGEFVYNNKAF
jgi:hypothetical protein